MAGPRILLQLDCDDRPSAFDSIVALDSGVDHLLPHAQVRPQNVTPIVHGAIFTRGGKRLQETAIFVGGSDVRQAEAVLAAVHQAFLGPLRVSVLMDANGCNTTSAAAVLALARDIDLASAEVLVLGASGPVGSRVVRLLASQGASVRVGSRRLDRAQSVCDEVAIRHPHAKLSAVEIAPGAPITPQLEGVTALVAAGAAGVELCPADARRAASSLRVCVDLNAVPPLGIGGIEVTDCGADRDGQKCFGAIGVGATKMAIHRAAIERLFTRNDTTLDAEEVFMIGQALGQ